jgi:hypothetical protein
MKIHFCGAAETTTGSQHLLEVKFDEYLPDYIYHAIQMTNMRLETFSKYYLCRQYNLRGYIL